MKPFIEVATAAPGAPGSTLLGRVFRATMPFATGRSIHSRLRNADIVDAEPIRAELFGAERLEQHAESLAAAQHVDARQKPDMRLERRLRDNERVLREAYLATVAEVRDIRSITPASDWLVDNFHVVQEQVRAIRVDLPPGFHKQLPRLIDGPFQGYPRVFGLSWAFVAHTDSRFDPKLLCRYLRAYQTVQPLTIGELWAVAIALRVVLVENLRRLAEEMVRDQAARQEANVLADQLLGDTTGAASRLLDHVATPLPAAFAVQLVRRLREEDPGVAPALRWLDATLAAQRTNAESIVEAQQQRQGAANVTIRNVITSMRLISSVDWRELFEEVSPVDAILRDGSNFAALDFTTRELYRHAIETLARGSRLSEIEITRSALAATEDSRTAAQGGDAAATKRTDPGYHLIGSGRVALAASVGCRVTFRARLVSANLVVGVSGYIALVAAITLLIVALVLLWQQQWALTWDCVVLGLLALTPASDAAVALVNYGLTSRVTAARLPSLALTDGAPPDLRTMVVMPVLLTSQASVADLVRRLEVHHLANVDGDLSFALLSDWTDSTSEEVAGDAELLRTATDGIAALNARYGSVCDGPIAGSNRFLLLHRRRMWNPGQRQWMGWERKRGKLHELNRLLRGDTDTTFIAIDGVLPVVPVDIHYVIILDSDTRLPRGAARRLIGKMAHPLNRPVFDAASGRVVDGYAVLQPRVTPALPSGREGSLFQRVFANASGMDPYASAVSDVYQDLFGEGSYCGKGIYDVDAFEAALAGRIADNTVLSHDLLEGIFARAGLVSDIEVIDEFPTRYDVAVGRQYRWARGDWQLLPWIIGFGMKADARHRRAVPLVGRWKMIDNLRRSLSAPAAFVALAAGWLLPFADAARWSAFLVAALAVPALIPFLLSIVPRQSGLARRMHLHAVAAGLRLTVSQIVLLVAFLPHQAWVMVEAIARTLFRLLVSQRNLLEWVTAGQAKVSPRLDLTGFIRQMAGGLLLTVAAMALVAFVRPGSWPIAAPIGILWLMSPVIARWISQPSPASGMPPILAADVQALRLIARRTWCFFETFVTAQENMLPPDNFQEDPKPVVAHRTSPTNMGLYLLSVVAARDFGWTGLVETIERLEATLGSMERLERHRGHFYNWYDTQDLRPLEPGYISSVDSGNLAGHLIALWNACDEIAARPVIDTTWRSGIEDPLGLLRQSLTELTLAGGAPAAEGAHGRQMGDALHGLADALRRVPATGLEVAAHLPGVAVHADKVRQLVHELPAGDPAFAATRADATIWAGAVHAAILGHHRSLTTLAPWAASLGADSELAALATPTMPGLTELPAMCTAAIDILQRRRTQRSADAGADAADLALITAFEGSATSANEWTARLTALSAVAHRLFDEMKFDFLFDRQRELLSIGYRIADGSLDPSCYDLLASEARLASFVAIAKGDLPTRHWFRLGRAMTPLGFAAALTSWTGSMFEYLMPSLVMRGPTESLLEETARQIVRQQIAYGSARHVPWGVSESAYNARDLEFTYQYSSFGIPDLALKHGLGADTVIAPYATALAVMVDPHAAVQNFAQLAAAGGRGRYGWYEALDYTKLRLPEGEHVAVIRAYMAHHQGMSVIAIADALGDGAMRRRFHAEPMIQATELLLQERTPHDVALAAPLIETLGVVARVTEPVLSTLRRFDSPYSASPRTHLLSNGRYAVMLTGAGSGYSRWRDIAVTRWQEDGTCDAMGSYVLLRDVESGAVWSAGFQPSGTEPDTYRVSFSEGRAEIIRRDGTITTTLEVAVSSEDDGEIRRVSITNHGTQAREIEVTSYAELVLAQRAADDAHPAFSKMFVETEFVSEVGALLATRRRRSRNDAEIWAAHLAVIEGMAVGPMQFETDRARFLGRGRSIRAPVAIDTRLPLSNTVGAVLDPVFSLRRRIRVAPKTTARIGFWTLVAGSRSEILDLVDSHREATAFERATTLAWTQAQVQLRHLGLDAEDANVFQRVANRMIYSDAAMRAPRDVLARGGGAPPILWQHGISGDLPILLVSVAQSTDLDLVRRLLLAHEYWRLKQLPVDLVILNEQANSYAQEFQVAIEALVGAIRLPPKLAATASQGAIFTLRADLISAETRRLLLSAARAVFTGHRGTLSEQLARVPEPKPSTPRPRRIAAEIKPLAAPPPPSLEYFNGIGGFAKDGREYVTILDNGEPTPAPWINVVANNAFGFQVTAEGVGSTWSLNSQQNHVTPWSNDPVRTMPGEVLYVRDEDSGEIWGPTALPVRKKGTRYVARHGQGYSRFEHEAHGIALDLLQYVPVDDPIKISRLTITNQSGRPRRLSITAYVEWVLGPTRTAGAPFILTEIDAATGAMHARNPWNIEFGRRVAFADLGGRQTSWTGDRREFIGRNGTLDDPAALAGASPLSNAVGAGFDPCTALQTRLEMPPNGSVEIVFLLGEAATSEEARDIVRKYRAADLAAVLVAVTEFWDAALGVVQVKTPDGAMDIMVNRWLLYQTLACRVWARAAFYQASGAYGFRDQLQDAMALCVPKPLIARAQLIRAASRQFIEGDVQHWWLPESGRGIRTHISDDRAWLVFAVTHYVTVTGDTAVLDEMVPFIEGPNLRDGEDDAFYLPETSGRSATLFEHCALALEHSLETGSHGLPLMGTGDWNDGMNRVGEQGKGESIWLGWFLHTALMAFAPLAETYGAALTAEQCRQHAAALRAALERNGWDGEWYLRAFFDDGTPLGSAQSEECRIDSIAQSWSVISGAADPTRAARAMKSVEKFLLRRDDELLLLFAPPFDKTSLDPGYIKGYPPGVRENGGQYTHGAIWSVIAFAMLGEGDKAAELFAMINPINHAATLAAARRYAVEPYVMAADVYSVAPHVGRGGWTWYTGSAGWMHRAALEWILGFRVQGETLLMDPCIPKGWPRFDMVYRHRTARYEIAVENLHGVHRGIERVELDGVVMPGGEARIALVDDGQTHGLLIVLG